MCFPSLRFSKSRFTRQKYRSRGQMVSRRAKCGRFYSWGAGSNIPPGEFWAPPRWFDSTVWKGRGLNSRPYCPCISLNRSSLSGSQRLFYAGRELTASAISHWCNQNRNWTLIIQWRSQHPCSRKVCSAPSVSIYSCVLLGKQVVSQRAYALHGEVVGSNPEISGEPFLIWGAIHRVDFLSLL